MTYYVDATEGDDNNIGTSPSDAWKTVGKVQSASLSSGDSVLFKRGETWTLSSELTATSGVTYGAYGSGDRPILDGGDTANGIIANGKDSVTIQDLEIINALDFGIGFGASGGTPASNGSVSNIVVSGSGNDNIIVADGSHDITLRDITSYDAYARVGGAVITNLEIADDAYNIAIDDFESYGSAHYGISIHAHNTEGLPYNITITDSSFRNNIQHGANIRTLAGSTAPADANIQFINCSFNDNTLQSFDISRATASEPYPSGITVTGSTLTGSPDGVYAAILRGANNSFTRNTFSANSRGLLFWDLSSSEFFNNTVYVPTSAVFTAILNIGGTDNSGTEIYNNIIHTDASANALIYVASGAESGLTIDYNLYYIPSGVGANEWNWVGAYSTWANWLSNSGQDANSPTPADPLFTDASSGDFTLQASSPAINAGVDVGLAYNGSAPDLGAQEYVYAPASPSSLAQYKSDGIVGIASGGWTNETNVVLEFSMSSINASDSLTPQIELREVDTVFGGSVTHSGTAIAFSGTPVTGSVIATGLTNGKNYHWQARVNNSAGPGSWALGGTFTVDTGVPSLTLSRIGMLDYQQDISIYYYTGSQPAFSGTGESGAAIALKIDGTAGSSGTIDSAGSWSLGGYTFLAGSYTVQITAADAAGNQTVVAFTLVVSPNWALFPNWLVSQLTGEELYPAEEPPPVGEGAEPVEEAEIRGNTVTVRLIDQRGQPLAGIWVTLTSESQTVKTDQNGYAVFPNVLPGEHTLSFKYGGRKVERTLNLLGDEQDYKIDVTVESVAPEGYYLGAQWYLWFLFGGIGVLALVVFLRSRVRK